MYFNLEWSACGFVCVRVCVDVCEGVWKQDYNMMIHEIQTGSNKRMSKNNNDIYHTPLEIENLLESTILLYLIENNFMIDLTEQDLHNDRLEQL